MVVQILENLISNSIYWMDLRAERDPRYRPGIRITLESGPPTITFEDNGRGIAPDNAHKVFKPFFSLKDTKRRRGLGLFIAREAASYHGGNLTLSDHLDPETRRLHRFILELPAGSAS
jgi:signal transduction histidine kinase